MKRFLKSVYFLWVAVVLFGVFALPVFVANFIVKKDKSDYLFSIAIGIDQLGGSILYGQPDWTISSYTYYMAMVNKRYNYLKRFIDFLFGKDHCKKTFQNEIFSTKRQMEALISLQANKGVK